MNKKLIILDRDGVVNYDSDNYIKSPAEWRPIPGSLEAIARLKQAGYQIAIATNQAGIARGLYDEKALAQIHQKMQDALAAYGAKIDAIFYCPHRAEDNCHCRKPKTGLFEQIATHFNLSLKGIYYIGDKKIDMDAGHNAGCSPILVKTGYGEETLAHYPTINVPTFANLAAAVDAILHDKV